MDLSNWYRGNLTWLHGRTILLTRHGSHAYGLNTPSSDLDVKGIAVPPREYFLGYANRFEQAESRDPVDLVVYDVRKFFALASACNPNIIEVLFTDESDHLVMTPAGRMLFDARDAFLSQRIKHTFSGYAMSQLKRINTHYRWLKNPPTKAPERAEFGLRAESEIPPEARDQTGAALALADAEVETWHELEWTALDEPQRIALRNRLTDYLARVGATKDALFVRAARDVGFDDNLIDLLQREKRYRSARQEWDAYQNWRKTRNAKRSELEAVHGYDTKHAMHLVRLLRMCREILETGSVVVKRPDREDLLGIRGGSWTYERLVEWAEKEDRELTELAKSSRLPRSPDQKRLDELCIRIVESML
jgi:predicted nucleotidyltransferase